MSLTLHLDLTPWRRHLEQTVSELPTLVPVAKGNGYGFGLPRLAREATRLGVEVLAVGTADEVPVVRGGSSDEPGWQGDVVVLTPWSRHDPVATALLDDPRVITTISRRDDLAVVAREHPRARVLLEVLTSMKRHGMTRRDLSDLPDVGQLAVEGWTIHLPLRGDTLREARELARACLAALPAPLWLSHLTPGQVDALAREVDVETRLRLGTSLWLGAPASRRVTSRVLDMHPVRRGERVGYWQRPMPADGWVVVLSGGTAHGVAMAAPSAASSWGQRARALVTGSMDATGWALSPFTLAGRKRFFVEPPHMQSSLVFLPGAGAVAVGDEVPVEVRLTTVTVERVDEA